MDSFHPLQVAYHLRVPHDIETQRRRLGGFASNQKVSLSLHQYHELLPFVSNVWSRYGGNIKDKPTIRWPFIQQKYRCKFFRSWGTESDEKRQKMATNIPLYKTLLIVKFHFKVVKNAVASEVIMWICISKGATPMT